MSSMKFLIPGLISLILFSCGGSQKIESEEFNAQTFTLDDFNSVSVSEGIEVILYSSDDNLATASSNFLPYLRIQVENENLLIYFEKPSNSIFNNKNKTRVEVWAKNVEKLKASSSASIEVQGSFPSKNQVIHASSSGSVEYDVVCDNLSIDVSSSGDYTGKINVNTLNANVSSSGDIEISGYVKTANLDASSSGDIDAKGLQADFVNANVSSSSDVTIAVNQSLKANVSSSGDLYYKSKGNIKLDVDESSGGGVQKIN